MAETKMVIIALLILAVGFFYTTLQDKFTGYASSQGEKDIEEQEYPSYESSDAQNFEVYQEEQQLISEQRTLPRPLPALDEQKKFIEALKANGALSTCSVPEALQEIIRCLPV